MKQVMQGEFFRAVGVPVAIPGNNNEFEIVGVGAARFELTQLSRSVV